MREKSVMCEERKRKRNRKKNGVAVAVENKKYPRFAQVGERVWALLPAKRGIVGEPGVYA